MKLRPIAFPDSLSNSAVAFRGYNITNLGRTPELLDHPAYGPAVESALREGSEVCAAVTGRSVDLVERVRSRRETCDLSTYAEDVALIVSVSMAQIRLLEEQFGVQFKDAKLTFGYSLGEASALIATGMYAMRDLLRVPLAMAADSVDLAREVTMGVLFSRGRALNPMAVQRLCQEINNRGEGVVGMSSILSPNCMLLLGQRGTIDQFADRMKERLTGAVVLRKNPHRWPPLHTPITWQRAIPNRVADMMLATPGGMNAPTVPIVSGVTGKANVTADNSRELIHQWVDHPQRLWDQIVGVLSAGVRTVIHVGPSPNLIPATFNRLAEDVRGQLNRRSAGGLGKRLVSRMVHRQWLAQLLPSAAVLLRAPAIHHINLEDWLLEEGAASLGKARAGAVVFV